MVVPVDYSHIVPGQYFSLFVLRHQASNKSKRLGSLVVNPGGPGGSGVDYAYGWDSIVSKAISDRYDIVGFDQRGVSLSDPIRCLTDAQEDAFLSSDGKVTDKASLASAIASAKDFANKCAVAAGSKLGHYSTQDGARDMELLRGLLGDRKLNYMGKSLTRVLIKRRDLNSRFKVLSHPILRLQSKNFRAHSINYRRSQCNRGSENSPKH